MAKPELIIVRGLPGSGKSVLAKRFTELDKKFVSISTDDFFTVNGVYCWDYNLLSIAHKWNLWRCKQLMKQRASIIVDNTNTTWKEIKPYVELAVSNEFKNDYFYTIFINEPATTWQYNVEECFKIGTHKVPKETIQKMRDRWQESKYIEDQICRLRETVS